MFTRDMPPVMPTTLGHHLIIFTSDTTLTPFMRTTTAILTDSAMATHRGIIALDFTVTIHHYMPIIITSPATRLTILTTATATAMIVVIANNVTLMTTGMTTWLEIIEKTDANLPTMRWMTAT